MIKKLAGCIREYKRDTILTPIYVTVEVILEVLIPYLMADLIDNGIELGDMAYIRKMGLLLVGLALASLFFGVMAGRTCARASAGFGKNLSHDMYHNIQNFSFSNIDKFSTAGLVTRMTTDITNVQQAFMMLIRMAVRSPGTFLFALIMAFRINRQLALVFLVVAPLLGVGLAFLMSHSFPLFEKVFKIYDKLNGVVQENLRGIRVVKSFVREDYECKKFSAVSTDLYDTFTKAETYMAFNAPLMQSAMYICTLLISWIGAKLIVSSTMTTGQLMSIITYTMQILMSLMMLSMIIVMSTIAKAAAQRIVEVLDEKTSITNCENPVKTVSDGSIVMEDVSFTYGRQSGEHCLSHINIEIKPGETVGIIGGTGSGKTSLVQLIPRLYDAVEGRVLVGGVDVKSMDIETLRQAVSMVLQKNVLFSGTIKENLRWGKNDATDEELVHACKIACADEFICKFPDGYDTYIEEGGTNVSGGQRQRLCIARALLGSPKILILDDSTSAVDTNTDAHIRKAMRDELTTTTKLIISQRISSVQDADRILVLDDGKVNAFDTHERLLANNAIYQEVFESQTKGGDFDVATK